MDKKHTNDGFIKSLRDNCRMKEVQIGYKLKIRQFLKQTKNDIQQHIFVQNTVNATADY